MCNGHGCDHCGNEGMFELTTCPHSFLSRDIREMVDDAELYKQGLPPVSGGTLDQGNKFHDCSRCWWSETDQLRAELGISS